MLTNQEATRKNILDAFQTYLYQWVQSDSDVVVFHYSGNGSNVIDPDTVFADGLNGTIVPVNAQLPDGFPQRGGEVDDITAGTIFLLREALGRKTKNVTFILDSCYAGGGVRGNLVLRSRPGQDLIDLRGEGRKSTLKVSQEELDYQQRWLQDLQLAKADWIDRRKNRMVNGVAIFAAQRNQEAADAAFAPGVHAGVFTYSLIRQLWQQTSNQGMGKVILAASAKTEAFLQNSQSQKPGFEVQQEGVAQQPMYFLPMQQPAAEAVITEVQGKTVKLLLTGVEPQVLEALGKGAVFTLVDNAGKPQGSVQIESRDRLTATGTLNTSAAVAPGAALQEKVRAVPRDLKLRIGLDPSLGQEATAAATALRSIPRIEAISPPLDEQDVHYILSRMQPKYRQHLEKQINDECEFRRKGKAWNSVPIGLPKRSCPGVLPSLENLPAINSVGLFAVGLEPIPGSFGAAGETVTDEIARLQTKLRLLLAARLIKMKLNTNSSRLAIVASLNTADRQALLAQSFTVRGAKTPPPPPVVITSSAQNAVAQVAINKPVQIVIENREPNQDLYVRVMIFSPDGDIDVLFPLTTEKNAPIVPAGQTQKIPGDADLQQGAKLSFQKPLGLAELLVVSSTAPIAQALAPIQALAAEKQNPQRSQSQMVEKTETVVASLLDDLAGGTRGGASSAAIRRFDVQQMAALSITFEIVA